MAKSITVKRKKGRPATGTEPLYGIRIADPLMKQIMDWAEAKDVTRSEAIRRLVEIGLVAREHSPDQRNEKKASTNAAMARKLAGELGLRSKK